MLHKNVPKKVYESDTGNDNYSSGGVSLLKADSDDTSGLESGADEIDMKTKVCSCLTTALLSVVILIKIKEMESYINPTLYPTVLAIRSIWPTIL